MKYLLFLLLALQPLLSKNALFYEDSPYLKAHAENLVDWYPWSDKAFVKAKKENKLIFLSIGFSTCHWCHIMEKESFENEEVAALFNKSYVSIKVDMETMPYIDSLYQEVLLKLTNKRNGWPLSIIMNADKEVLYISIYIPKDDKYGAEGFTNLLPRFANMKKTQREALIKKHKKQLSQPKQLSSHDSKQKESTLFIDALLPHYDTQYKGFYKRPRFPLPSHLNGLLDIYALEHNASVLSMVTDTLDAMGKGGIYDQVEGAFFRYSTHRDWIIPHYEKMLYNNAELAAVYLKAYAYTQNPWYKKIAFDTLVEMNAKFRTKDYLYMGASDADGKDGKEGSYFLFTQDEVSEALEAKGFSEDEIDAHLEYLDITCIGNFKGELSNARIRDEVEKPKRLDEVLGVLRGIRGQREFPFIDPKILLSWNALMIKTLYIAGHYDKAYRIMAEKSYASLLKNFYADKKLFHYYVDTNVTHSSVAMLEDYSFLIDLLLTRYQSTFEHDSLDLAKKLTREAIDTFYTKEGWLLTRGFESYSGIKDKYYVSALSRLLNVMQSVADLTYDLSLAEEVKGYVNEQRERILHDVDKHPEGVLALMRLREGNIMLKSHKEKLKSQEENILKIKHPFVLLKDMNITTFDVCTSTSCFASGKSLNAVIPRIEKKRNTGISLSAKWKKK